MSKVLNSSNKMSVEQAVNKITDAYLEYLCEAALGWLRLKKVNVTIEKKKLIIESVIDKFENFLGYFIRSNSLTKEELQSAVSSIISMHDSYKKFLAVAFVKSSLPTIIS